MPDAASKPEMTTPTKKRRRWPIIALSVLGVLVVVRGGLELWGRSRLDALVREIEPEWSEAEGRLKALGHPWDPSAKEACEVAYSEAGVDLGEDSLAVSAAISAPPRARVSERARTIVEAHRPTIDAFLRATGCGAYAPHSGEAWAPFERPFPIFVASRLVVLDARLRAEKGDVQGAVERLLAVTKAGADFGEGSLVAVLVGGGMISAAQETLATLIADGKLAEPERERVSRALAALAPRMPTIVSALARERLSIRRAALLVQGGDDALQMRDLTEAEGASATSASWVMPLRAAFAASAWESYAYLKRAGDLVAKEHDSGTLRSELVKIEPKDGLFGGLTLPATGLVSQSRNLCLPAAWTAMTRASLAIAKAGSPKAGLSEPIADPCGTSDLSYAATTDDRGVLWSAGKDGASGGDDLRLEVSGRGAVSAPVGDAAQALDERAALTFVSGGKSVRDVTLGEMLRELPAETFTVYDPYYSREKTFRAVPISALIHKGFSGVELPLPQQEYVLRAKDGYTVPMRGSKLFEAGGYIAFADVDVPAWEPIGPQRANPGPFYLVWRDKGQESLETHPRPWQLASIEIARFEDVFPHTYPKGQAEGSAALRGFAIFKEHCVHCHSINREGGRVGPDLNVPKSIVEYRPLDQIKAYIRDPSSFRYGNMPAHPFLQDNDLTDITTYLSQMKDLKHDKTQEKAKK